MSRTAELLSHMYSVSGLVMLTFYLPQMERVLRSKTDLRDVSIMTWGVWALCMGVTTSYATVVIGDTKLAVFSGVGAIFCGFICSVTVVKRMRYSKTGSLASSGLLSGPAFSRFKGLQKSLMARSSHYLKAFL